MGHNFGWTEDPEVEWAKAQSSGMQKFTVVGECMLMDQEMVKPFILFGMQHVAAMAWSIGCY